MLSKALNKALNKQVQLEFESSNVYLAMASWAEQEGYEGIANFMYLHSDEERMHMLKIFKYINERGGEAEVPALGKVEHKYKSVVDMFTNVLKHEVHVSSEINNLVDSCLKEKDYATHNMLQWYVAEQMEEERLARTLLDKLKLIGNDKSGTYMFDRDLNSGGGEGGEKG
jgi:ferritin